MGAEYRDLTIENVLADPLIRAANKADHVSLQDFEDLLRSTARDLKASVSGRSPALDPNLDRRSRCGDWSSCFA